ncbi:MAG: hypothetical protein H5T61_06945 [Thermoflexales bacterium]|nr:hypothetical protein [Thermoflexales bacterium]
MEEQPEVPFTEQPTYPGGAEVPGEKKSRTGLIIGIVVGVVLLILCCCCIIAALIAANWNTISQGLGF